MQKQNLYKLAFLLYFAFFTNSLFSVNGADLSISVRNRQDQIDKVFLSSNFQKFQVDFNSVYDNIGTIDYTYTVTDPSGKQVYQNISPGFSGQPKGSQITRSHELNSFATYFTTEGRYTLTVLIKETDKNNSNLSY